MGKESGDHESEALGGREDFPEKTDGRGGLFYDKNGVSGRKTHRSAFLMKSFILNKIYQL